jgi:hypothetical protein
MGPTPRAADAVTSISLSAGVLMELEFAPPTALRERLLQMGFAEEIDAIPAEQFLNGYVRPWTGDPATVVSTFAAALRDARLAASRDADNGLPRSDAVEHSSSWLGTVGYFIVLDQLGAAVRPRGSESSEGRDLVRALTFFAPEITRADVEAIYGLRCALVHDYSLVHRGRPSKPSYHFRLCASDDDFLVEHATTPWSGEPRFPEEREETTTVVNLREVAWLVDRVAQRVRRMATNRRLAVAVRGGNNELAIRYFFQITSED